MSNCDTTVLRYWSHETTVLSMAFTTCSAPNTAPAEAEPVCPACEGIGEVEIEVTRDVRSFEPPWDTATCLQCRGSGEVPDQKEGE